MAKKPASLADTPGTRIQAARLKAGISLAGLADRIGTTEGAIRQIEAAGPENYPKLPNALKIAAVLGLDPWVVAFGADANLERKRLGVSDVLEGDGAELLSQRLRAELMGEIRGALEDNRSAIEKLGGRVGALERQSGQGGGGKRTRR